ncbi:MAG: hypothetical protein KIG56_00210, partial [Bacteroidales bacterium]|nr:hypothetical protein [Bacteroidales bacterium]
YTGRYIYPLTVACQELHIFLWLDDKTRIKNSNGLTRGKNDLIDAAGIAEYALLYSDKAVRFCIPDAALVSMKNLLADREFLLIDRKRQGPIKFRELVVYKGGYWFCLKWL